MLSSTARDFLLQSQSHPGWLEILAKIEELTGLPKYNPNDKKSTDAQSTDWVFHSGRLKENERILQILRNKL